MPIFRFDPEVSPSLTASFFMASALCFHFFGYEMARAASIALLAAKVIKRKYSMPFRSLNDQLIQDKPYLTTPHCIYEVAGMEFVRNRHFFLKFCRILDLAAELYLSQSRLEVLLVLWCCSYMHDQ